MAPGLPGPLAATPADPTANRDSETGRATPIRVTVVQLFDRLVETKLDAMKYLVNFVTSLLVGLSITWGVAVAMEHYLARSVVLPPIQSVMAPPSASMTGDNLPRP